MKTALCPPMPVFIPLSTVCACGHTKYWHTVYCRCQHPDCVGGRCAGFHCAEEIAGEPGELDGLITLDCGCTGKIRNAEHSGGQLVCEEHLEHPVQLPDYQQRFLKSVNESFKPWRDAR